MELEYFVKPGTDDDIHNLVQKRLKWWADQGASWKALHIVCQQ